MDLQEENRGGHIVSAEMKRLWAVQMDLAKKLLAACEKHNLSIWAEAGTLLGAVRHQGYIPWDDDMDFVMFRKDYDRLIKIAPDEFKDPYFLQSFHSENRYPRGHAQLRNSGTAAILSGDVFQNFNQGIFIDIFVMDRIPDDEGERRKLQKKSGALLRRMHAYNYFSLRSLYHPRLFFACIEAKLYYLQHSYQSAYEEYENLFRAQPIDGECEVGLIAWNWESAGRFHRNSRCYGETIYLPFEDMKIPAPKGYDEILKNIYGDYMTPVKAPSCHGGYICADTERPYSDILPLLRRNARKHYWADFRRRALFHMKKLLGRS